MFESLFENLLKSILGNYVEDLDQHKLSISVWSGRISLTNLKLKSTIFQAMNLPFVLKEGYIKSLNIDVPWSRLSSSPVVAQLDTLSLVLAPQPESEWILQDETSHEFKAEKLKKFFQAKLAEGEAALMKQLEQEMDRIRSEDGKSKEAGKQAGLFQRYLTRIKDNIKVSIENVSLRVEEDSQRMTAKELNSKNANTLEDIRTSTGDMIKSVVIQERACLGIELKLLRLRTVAPTAAEKDEGFFFNKATMGDQPLVRLVEVEGLSVYADFQSAESVEELDWKFRYLNLKDDVVEPSSNDDPTLIPPGSKPYVLVPQSASVKLIQNPTTHPIQFEVDASIGILGVALKKEQYKAVVRLGDHIRRYKRQHQLYNRFKKYKPFRPVYSINYPYLNEDGSALNDPIEAGKDEMAFDEGDKRPIRKMNPDCEGLQASDFTLASAIRQLHEQAGIKEPSDVLAQIEAISEEEDREYSMVPSSFRELSDAQKKRSPNGCARAWWKFAISSVIKDNRQKAKATWQEFQLSKEQSEAIFKCLDILLQEQLSSFEKMKEAMKADKKNKKKEIKFEVNLASFSKSDRSIYQYCLEAVPLAQLKTWISSIVKNYYQTQFNSKKEKLIEQASGRAKPKKLVKTDDKQAGAPVKSSYSSSIMSYLGGWSTKPASSEQLMKQQQEVEAAVEKAAEEEEKIGGPLEDAEQFFDFPLAEEEEGDPDGDRYKFSSTAEPLPTEKKKNGIRLAVSLQTFKLRIREVLPGSDVVVYVEGLSVNQEQSPGSKSLVVQSERCGVEHWEQQVGDLAQGDLTWKKHSLVLLEEQKEGDGPSWKFELRETEDRGLDLAVAQPSLDLAAVSRDQVRTRYETKLDSRAVHVNFNGKVVKQLVRFFRVGEGDELRAQALDQLILLAEQSQMNLIDIIQKDKISKINFNIDALSIHIPFLQHNSKLKNEAEEQRPRSWNFEIKKLTLTNPTDPNLSSIYELFKVGIESLAMTYGKRDYRHRLKVLEPLPIQLDIQIKNKLKAYILEEQVAKMKPATASNEDNPSALSSQPNLKVVVANGASLKGIRLNFTPDAYNSLINIAGIISPESTKMEVIRQYNEKKTIMKMSLFASYLPTLGVREQMLTNNWTGYYVVFSGSYLYFYRTQRDLMPYHYLYVMSITFQQQKKRHDFADLAAVPDDDILIINGRNAEQILLNFGTDKPDTRNRGWSSSSHQSTKFGFFHHSNDRRDSKDTKREELRRDSHDRRERHSSSQASHESAWFEKRMTSFKNLILRKQEEIRSSSIFEGGQKKRRVEAISQLAENSTTLKENKYKRVNFSLELPIEDVGVRVFQYDFPIMNDDRPNYDYDSQILVKASAKGILATVVYRSFDSDIAVSIGSLQVWETQRLHREVVSISKPLHVSLKMWSVNSPTIEDSEMSVEAVLEGRPIIFYDPQFINSVIKFLRNTKNAGNISHRRIVEKLIEEDKEDFLSLMEAVPSVLKSKIENDPYEISFKDFDSSFASDLQFDSDEEEEQDGKAAEIQKYYTCKNVKLILMKVEAHLIEGISLIGFHHEFTLYPFLEVDLERLDASYHMMFDHDVMKGEFRGLEVNDLTQWPKTIDPNIASLDAKAHTQEQAEAWKAHREAGDTLEEFEGALPMTSILMELKRQKIVGRGKLGDQFSGIKLHYESHWIGCPLRTNEVKPTDVFVDFQNIRMNYYQEQFMRMLNYFTNRFLWALSYTDPYAEFREQPAPLTWKEINELEDLKQFDFAINLNVDFKTVSIALKERPYIEDKMVLLDFDSMTIRHTQETVLGRHQNLPSLPMKLSNMNIKFGGVSLSYYDRAQGRKTRKMSSDFNIDFVLTYPNYSPLFEKIRSHVLDKSSRIKVTIHPELTVNLDQEVFTQVMRTNSLNLTYSDQRVPQFQFTQVNEIFQTKDTILYMRSCIDFEDDLIIKLRLENKEIVEMVLRKHQSRQSSGMTEMIRVDQFLDRQMKVHLQMGIPTLLSPTDDEIFEEQQISPAFQHEKTKVYKHLLIGTETDSHLIIIDEDEVKSENLELQVEGEDETEFKKAEPSELLVSTRTEMKINDPSKLEPAGQKGKLLFKMQWTPDGTQQMECRIDKAKIILRPYDFLMVSHFFGYGLPKFDTSGFEKPLNYITNFESLGVMKMKIEILDSSILCDNFDKVDIENFHEQQYFTDHPLQDQSMSQSFFSEKRNATGMSRMSSRPSLAKSHESQPAEEDPRSLESFLTVVSRIKRVEYSFSRDHIKFIKETLFEKLKAFVAKLKEGRLDDDLDFEESSAGGAGVRSSQSSKRHQPEEEKKEASFKSKNFSEEEASSTSKSLEKSNPLAKKLTRQITMRSPVEREEEVRKEVSRQTFMRTIIKIRQFSPYICSSFLLDEVGFEDIQKRQIISPINMTYINSKLLRLDYYKDGRPAFFIPFYKNEVNLDQTLVKATFSDIGILQEVATKLMASQKRYTDFLVTYLSKYKKDEIMREFHNDEQRKFTSAKHSFSFSNHRTERGKETFHSFFLGSDAFVEKGEQPQVDDEAVIQTEAEIITQQMRQNMLNYITSFSSKKQQPRATVGGSVAIDDFGHRSEDPFNTDSVIKRRSDFVRRPPLKKEVSLHEIKEEDPLSQLNIGDVEQAEELDKDRTLLGMNKSTEHVEESKFDGCDSDIMIEWNVDYGDDPNSQVRPMLEYQTSLFFSGLQVLIINDNNHSFHPMFQASLDKLSFSMESKDELQKGDTEVKLLVNYFNSRLDLWEPFLEKCQIKISLDQDLGSTNILAQAKTPINFNLTEELFDTLSFINKESMPTQKQQAAATPAQNQDISKSIALQASQLMEQRQEGQKKVANLDFKIRSHRIVNMTTQGIVIRRNNIGRMLASHHVSIGKEDHHKHHRHDRHDRHGDHRSDRKDRSSRDKQGHVSKRFQNNLTKHPIINKAPEEAKGGAPPVMKPSRHRSKGLPSKYQVASGSSVDYEVDFEEEARQLVMTSQEDLTRKQDFIDIIFDGVEKKIRAYNLANQELHQHSLSSDKFDFVVFGLSHNSTAQGKTFTIRSPFVISNKTDVAYLLKFSRYQKSEEAKIIRLEPGEFYPLAYSQFKDKIELAQALDADQEEDPERAWSSPFKVQSFVQKNDVQTQKFFVYHAKKFSMVFVQPGQFFSTWDICIKIPVIIRNCLPFDFKVRIPNIKKYIQPRSMLMSSQKRKEVIFDSTYSEITIPRQETRSFYNFNLDGEVRFHVNLDLKTPEPNKIESLDDVYLMNWAEFLVVRDEFKHVEKRLILTSQETMAPLELNAKIRQTEQTDIEITFFAKHCVVNYTDQNLVLYDSEGFRKQLPCQTSQNNPVTLVSSHLGKVQASIHDEGLLPGQQTSHKLSEPFSVGIAGIMNQISISKEKTKHFEFIASTSYSLISPELSIYSMVTSIHPMYVICNYTDKFLLLAQTGLTKLVEVIQQRGRLPFYWTDPKGHQTIQFKLAPVDQFDGFDDTQFEWSKPIKPQKIGREAIQCRNKSLSSSEHVVVIKQANQKTQTIFLIFKIESQSAPMYRIENKSESLQMECFQAGFGSSDDWKQVVEPSTESTFSWADPERSKSKREILVNLNLVNRQGLRVKTLRKVEVEPDSLEFSSTFYGQFFDLEGRQELTTKNEMAKSKRKVTPLFYDDANGRQERIVKLEMLTDGLTKILRLTETEKDQRRGSTEFKIRRVAPKLQRNMSQLMEVEDIQMDEDDDSEEQRELKLQVNIGSIFISFVARNDSAIRKEFLLALIQNTEFLMIDSRESKDVQLRIQYFQLDNNLNSDSRQLFPYVMYPKDYDNHSAVAQGRVRRFGGHKDFFNSHILMKKTSTSLSFIEKLEFLVQSAVLQMDDEVLSWIIKFIDTMSSNLGGSIASRHVIFQSNDLNFSMFNPGLALQRSTITRVLSEYKSNNPQPAEQPLRSPTVRNFSSRNTARALTVKPEIREGIYFRYQAFDPLEKYPNILVTSQADSWLNFKIDTKHNPVFIKSLILSPIDFQISFKTRVKTENEILIEEQTGAMRRLKQFGLSLSNIDKATFRLNSLSITNVYGSPEDIQSVLITHYKSRIIRNLLGLFLSSSALGNMNLLAHDLGTGFKDFFYKPIEGFINGPIEGGKGLAIGTASLLGNTASGTLGAMSRVINTVSKSLLFLAGDEDYIDQREQDAIDKPENLYQGLKSGIKSTVSGIASGVSGVVQQPMKGARREGVKGFMKGTFKGIRGVIVKPISGTLDFVMKTTEGAQNMVRVGGRRKKPDDSRADSANEFEFGVHKIRTFRPFYGKQQRLKSFHEFQAHVALNLKFICEGVFAHDNFLDAIVYNNGLLRLCIILTDERLLVVDAIEKTLVKDFMIEELCIVECRPITTGLSEFAEELELESEARTGSRAHQTDVGQQLVNLPTSGPRPSDQGARGYLLVIRVFQQSTLFRGPSDFKYPEQRPEFVLMEGDDKKEVADGFSLIVKDEKKARNYVTRLNNFILYVNKFSH